MFFRLLMMTFLLMFIAWNNTNAQITVFDPVEINKGLSGGIIQAVVEP